MLQATKLHADPAGGEQGDGDPDPPSSRIIRKMSRMREIETRSMAYTALWMACSMTSSAVFGFGFS